MEKDGLKKIFPIQRNRIWTRVQEDLENIREIRIRVGKPVLIYRKNKEMSLDAEGTYIYDCEKGKQFSYAEIQELLNYWCEDSRYAFQEEIKRGFLTVPGGHRIGISGESVIGEQGEIQTLKYISFLNIRIAHQVTQVIRGVLKEMYEGQKVLNTLIISPPGAGKTTLLRDMARQISDGNSYAPGQTVGIVDERSEIAACFQGKPQLDIGGRSDVLDGCPKALGIMMLLRSMAPKVIAVDELGSKEDIAAIEQAAGSGCSILATVHGNSLEEIQEKQLFLPLFQNHIFSRILVLHREKDVFYKKLYKTGEEKPCFIC